MVAQIINLDPMAALLKRIGADDKVAASKLVAQLSPKLFRTAFRILQNRDDAEDVTQEALIKLWKIAGNWQNKGAKVETWCYRVVTNLCLDKLRAQKRFIGDDLSEEIASGDKNPFENLAQNESQNAIDIALEQLASRQKMALILTYYEGLSGKDAASAMDITVEALESLLARAKKSLKNYFIVENPQIGASILREIAQ